RLRVEPLRVAVDIDNHVAWICKNSGLPRLYGESRDQVVSSQRNVVGRKTAVAGDCVNRPVDGLGHERDRGRGNVWPGGDNLSRVRRGVDILAREYLGPIEDGGERKIVQVCKSFRDLEGGANEVVILENRGLFRRPQVTLCLPLELRQKGFGGARLEQWASRNAQIGRIRILDGN